MCGNNQFAYCFNNPVAFTDSSGQFPVFAFVVIAICVIGGGIAGYMYDDELGSELAKENPSTYKPLPPKQNEQFAPHSKPDLPHGVTEDMLPGFSDNNSSPNNQNMTTAGVKLKNTLIGASLGLLGGGAIVATVGVGAALCTGYAFASVGFLGGSAAQTFAIGAIAIDIFAITIAPIFGIEMEPIEGKE